MKRSFRALAFAVTTLIAPTAFADDDVSLALPALSLSFSPVYIADEMGYWKSNGIAMKFPLLPGVGASNAVLAGSVEFANASGPTLIRATARGQKLYAIATTVERIQLGTVLAKPIAEAAGITAASPIQKKAQVLKGKTIAVDSVNSVVHSYLRYFARKGGVDPEREITVTAMQPPSMLAGLKNGSIAGFTMSLPWTIIPVHEGSAVRLVSSLHGDFPELSPFAFLVLATRQEVCDKKPDLCRRVIAGLGRAYTYMKEHPQESLRILRARLPDMDSKVLAEGFELVRASTPKTPTVEEASLAKAQDYMVATGMMTADEKLSSFKDIYTNAYTGN